MSGAEANLRVPPMAIDAERAVLGGLMLAPSALTKVSDWLREDDFYRRDHRLIYRALGDLAGRPDAAIDAVTMAEWFDANDAADLLDGGSSYLIDLANETPSAANIVAYAEIVAERARLREAISVGTEFVEAAWAPGADSQTVISAAVHRLSSMQGSKLRGGLELAKVALKRATEAVFARYHAGPGLLGLPWPWKDLNDCTKGLRKKTLYVVGARPSMGKSIFGLQAAVFSALRGSRVAFFSVEMGAEECMTRAIAMVGEIPHEWVEHPDDNHPDAELYWARMYEAIAKLSECELLIDETPTISARQLYARAHRAHMQKPLDLIVVDHMHDMEVDPKNARFDYGVITQTGKTMAKQFDCPVVLLAQLNRGSQERSNKRPVMSDLRESGEIEQKADVILFLHREDYYKAGEMPGVVEVIPAKGRNLRLAETIYLRNVFHEMRMTDWVGSLPAPANDSDAGFRRRAA